MHSSSLAWNLVLQTERLWAIAIFPFRFVLLYLIDLFGLLLSSFFFFYQEVFFFFGKGSCSEKSEAVGVPWVAIPLLGEEWSTMGVFSSIPTKIIGMLSWMEVVMRVLLKNMAL